MMHGHTDKLSAYISFVSVLPWRPATASSVSSGKIEHAYGMAWYVNVAWIDVGDGRCANALGSSSSSSRSKEVKS